MPYTTGPTADKMRFGAILDHLEAIWDHLGPLEKFENFRFWAFFGHFWSFWGHFGPYLDLMCPQSEGGSGQNAPKTSPNGPKMRFGAILDHLEAIFVHFGPFEKS